MNKQEPKISSDNVTRKVILLSICEKLDSLTKQEFMQSSLETMYMDYFQFSELLDELTQEKLIISTLRKNEATRTATGHAPERYSITEKGLQVLDTLRTHLPVPVSAYLERSMQARGQALKEKQSITATWQIMPNGHYQVTLSLFEYGQRYFYLEIDQPSESQAKALCSRWKNKAISMYPKILQAIQE